MQNNNTYIGKNLSAVDTNKTIDGKYTHILGEKYFKISNYEMMPPFFTTVVSNSNHWIFISSNGALAAGRTSAENAIFPYYTDDKIHDSAEITGSKTILKVEKNNKNYLWEPFSERFLGAYDIQRNIYKNVTGNKICFEEQNNDLGVIFRYFWQFSSKFGLVKKSQLINLKDVECKLTILDGFQNILPADVDRRMQQEYSTLVDAYKMAEFYTETELAIYRLSSIPVDRAEPSEALRATTAWGIGLENPTYLLSSGQLNRFRYGQEITAEDKIRGVRCAFFMKSEIVLAAQSEKIWYAVVESNQDAKSICELNSCLTEKDALIAELEKDVEEGTDKLEQLVLSADGLQVGGDDRNVNRHYSNVLFNIMRGGTYPENYDIQIADFLQFLETSNLPVFSRHCQAIHKLGSVVDANKLKTVINDFSDPDLIRLFFEYLPLTFSRRHGDPSRPWNMFSIETENKDGSQKLDYEGNWRDIFQNWEALTYSFPGFIQQIIYKFLNASTADGYNPYRITRNGIDWEITDPEDPWSYIGYWNDHQIIYLLKFLELSEKFFPGQLEESFGKELFAYANVPYRIKSYEAILENPRDTIEFDFDLQEQIDEKVAAIGSDGRLILAKSGNVLRVNFVEKILVMLLVKVTNFIPDAGIWLNTQRPEWNDANNALVGNGVSMVTVYYLRRFMKFALKMFSQSKETEFTISQEVAEYFELTRKAMNKHSENISGFSEQTRKNIMDDLGRIGSQYRVQIYDKGFSEEKGSLNKSAILEFCELALAYFDQSIENNQRADHLYHSYNLVELKPEACRVHHLYEMLEGQVSVLSSGYLKPDQAVKLLDGLRAGKLYRADQNSYILYPNRELPGFLVKNIIPKEQIEQSTLLNQLNQDNDDSIIVQDRDGKFHFNYELRNSAILKEKLLELPAHYQGMVNREIDSLAEMYDLLFEHQSFTGRSGTFFKYEGLGSIYWHMVSKLLLAVMENLNAAGESGNKAAEKALIDHYYEIRQGIGAHKSPEKYGAFPTDAYSHTPAHLGVQQPGLTGQVKEDIISRWAELGIQIEEGKLGFSPKILKPFEYLTAAAQFEYNGLDGKKHSIELSEGSFAFTFCQIPIVYHTSIEEKIHIHYLDGKMITKEGCWLDQEVSQEIFKRGSKIFRLEVFIKTPDELK